MELTSAIALENLRECINLALGIGAAGYSEGMVCAVPATATEAWHVDDLKARSETAAT